MTVSARLISLIGIALLFSGCIDEYESKGPDPNAYRITWMTVIDSSGKSTNRSFEYNSFESRLYSIWVYSVDTLSDSNTKVAINSLENSYINYPESSYPEYNITVKRYISRDDDMFMNDEVISEILIHGDIRVKETESTNLDDTIRRTEYIYDEYGRLTESRHYKLTPPIQKEFKKDYTYSNGHISLMKSFKRNSSHEWVETEKTEFTFSGDKLSDYTVSDLINDEWVEKKRTVYTYSGLNVTGILTYIKESSGDWSLFQSEGFEYDQAGNLIADSIQRGTYSQKRKMRYKKGEGNARQIFMNPIDELFRKPYIK